MEFTYRISKTDFVDAAWLRRSSLGTGRVRYFVGWVCIIVFLASLWFVVGRSISHIAANPDFKMYRTDDSVTSVDGPPSVRPSATPHLILRLYAALLLLIWSIPWLILFYKLTPKLRTMYRRDPLIQGEITASVTPELFSLRNSAGGASQSVWNVYEHWIERGNLILVVRNSHYVALNIAGLTDAQRAELRSILSAALPTLKLKTRLSFRDLLRNLIHGER